MDNKDGKDAPFSIANIVDEGLNYDRKPGDWYGPSTMIQIFEKLNDKYKPFPNVEIVAFPEGIMYINTVQKKIEKRFTPLIVLIAFRVGLKRINPEYFDSIINVMQFKNFMGIAGAQGDSALYFIGYQGKNLIYLDPHVTQEAVEMIENLWIDHLSYHCPSTLTLPIGKLNTSFSIGFYLRTKEDYDVFIQEMKEESKRKDSFIQIYEKELDKELSSIDYDDFDRKKNEEIYHIEKESKDGFVVC